MIGPMKKQKLASVVLGLLLAVLCLPRTALAYTEIPELGERLCSLTVTSPHGGVIYDAYRVCDVDARVNFTPCVAFTEMAGSIERAIESAAWTTLTDTLDTWVVSQGIQPDATVQTDSAGQGRFENLATGLYLIRGREYLTDAGYYIPKSFMICLPNWVEPGAPGNANGAEADWVYDVTAIPKGSTPDRELTARSVLKVWRGSGSEERPTSVTAQLLRTDRATGETVVYDTVTLNGRNGWSNLWTELDNVNYTWTVQEIDVPGEYDVLYRQDGVNVIITNYYTPPHNDPPPPEPPDDPPPPDEPPSDEPPPPEGPPPIPDEEIDEPPIPLDPPPEEEIDEPPIPLSRLPQTGMLWWPVPILAMGGMSLFALGWALNRRKRYEEE